MWNLQKSNCDDGVKIEVGRVRVLDQFTGLDETLVSVSISHISWSKFLVSVSSRSRKIILQKSRSRLGLEITILKSSRYRLGLAIKSLKKSRILRSFL